MKKLQGPIPEIQKFIGVIDFITSQLYQNLNYYQGTNLYSTDEYKLFFILWIMQK